MYSIYTLCRMYLRKRKDVSRFLLFLKHEIEDVIEIVPHEKLEHDYQNIRRG